MRREEEVVCIYRGKRGWNLNALIECLFFMALIVKSKVEECEVCILWHRLV